MQQKENFNRRFRTIAESGGFLRGGKMLKDMQSNCHLKPGLNGTRRLVAEYGDRLLCVRYRFDATRGVKIKGTPLEERLAELYE